MPNKPTDKRQKVSLDPITRSLFIEACGGGCVNPTCTSKPGTPLQLGHLQRDKDDGPVSFENLQPLCAKCNGGFNKGFSMPDFRPPDWRFRFLELFAQTLGLEPRPQGVTPSPENGVGVHTVLPQKPVDDKGTYRWAAGLFALNLELPKPARYPHDPYPLEHYEAVVEETVRLGANHFAPIPSPTDEKLRSKLLGAVKRLGRENFLAAAREFIRQEKWFEGGGQYIRRLMVKPWENFVANIDMYLRDAQELARKKAKDEANVKASLERYAVEVQERALKERWQEFLNIRLLVGSPAMTQEDQEFIARVSGIPENVQPVSDADYERVIDMRKRERDYRKTTKKYKLLETITNLGVRVLRGELRFNREATAEFARLRKLVEAASYHGPELDAYRKELADAVKKGAITERRPVEEPEE